MRNALQKAGATRLFCAGRASDCPISTTSQVASRIDCAGTAKPAAKLYPEQPYQLSGRDPFGVSSRARGKRIFSANIQYKVIQAYIGGGIF